MGCFFPSNTLLKSYPFWALPPHRVPLGWPLWALSTSSSMVSSASAYLEQKNNNTKVEKELEIRQNKS